MTKNPRRAFLKQSAAIVSGLTLSSCDSTRPAGPTALDARMLEALGESVLPASTLGASGVARVVADFEKWLQGFEPVAERDHGYLTSEIEYGPPDPAPRWRSQLEALELECQKRHGKSFAELQAKERQVLLRKQIRRDPLDRLPDAAEARHVAVGLLAHFYTTPEANDLCYQAEIAQYSCRGLQSAPGKPAPLKKGA